MLFAQAALPAESIGQIHERGGDTDPEIDSLTCLKNMFQFLKSFSLIE